MRMNEGQLPEQLFWRWVNLCEQKWISLSERHRVAAMIEQERMTMRKLRRLVFGDKAERINRVGPPVSAPAQIPPVPKPRHAGHGRIKARDYTGADSGPSPIRT